MKAYSNATATAVIGGQLYVLQWLVERGCPWHVQSGPRGWIQAGHKYDFLKTRSLCEHAAFAAVAAKSEEDGRRYVSILKWLVDHKQHLEPEVCLAAFGRGHPSFAELTSGSLYASETIRAALRNTHGPFGKGAIHTYDWLVERLHG